MRNPGPETGLNDDAYVWFRLVLCIIPLLLRGKAKVATEVNLYAAAYIFKRLLNCIAWNRIKKKPLPIHGNLHDRLTVNAVL